MEQQDQSVEQNGGEETAPPALDLANLPPEVALFIEQLTKERDEAQDARMRALADFKNYQRRSIENEQRARRDSASSIVRGLFPALDHFDLALQNTAQATSVEQVAKGIRMVKDELLRSLEANGIKVLIAEPGSDFDPEQQEAVAQQPCEGIKPGQVGVTVQAGYAYGDMVLRPTKVVIADG